MTTPTTRDLCTVLVNDVFYLLACIQDGSSDSHVLQQCRDHVSSVRDALATEPVGEGPILQWTENMPPSEKCRYDHCIAETPFGRFLVSWKGWKQFDSPTIDETPWGDWYEAFHSVDAAKAACQKEMDERIARWGRPAAPPASEVVPSKLPTQHQIDELLKAISDAYSSYGWIPDKDFICLFDEVARLAGIIEDGWDASVDPDATTAKACAALARWGRPATPPAPVAVGEAAELAEELRIMATLDAADQLPRSANLLTRAADLLQQFSAPAPAVVPVAVAERLPEPSIWQPLPKWPAHAIPLPHVGTEGAP